MSELSLPVLCEHCDEVVPATHVVRVNYWAGEFILLGCLPMAMEYLRRPLPGYQIHVWALGLPVSLAMESEGPHMTAIPQAETPAVPRWAQFNDWVRPWYPEGSVGHVNADCDWISEGLPLVEGSGWLNLRAQSQGGFTSCEECVGRYDPSMAKELFGEPDEPKPKKHRKRKKETSTS